MAYLTKPRILLTTSLVLAIGVPVFATDAPPARVERVTKGTNTAESIAVVAETAQVQNSWADKLQRSKSAGKSDVDPFTSKSWLPPPKVAPPPAPTVPAFPYTYLGKMEQEGSVPKLILMRGEQLFTVAAGETLENTYRVDEIGESQVAVTYLPLDKKQQMSYADITPKGNQTTAAYAPPANPPPQPATQNVAVMQNFAGNSSPSPSSPGISSGAAASTGGFGGAGFAAGAAGAQNTQGIGVANLNTTLLPPQSSSGSVGGTTLNSPVPGSSGGSMQMLPPPPNATLPMLPPAPSGFMHALPPPSGQIATLPPPSTPPQTSPPPVGVSPIK